MASFIYESHTVKVAHNAASPQLLGNLLKCSPDGMSLLDPSSGYLIPSPETMQTCFEIGADGEAGNDRLFYVLANPLVEESSKPGTPPIPPAAESVSMSSDYGDDKDSEQVVATSSVSLPHDEEDVDIDREEDDEEEESDNEEVYVSKSSFSDSGTAKAALRNSSKVLKPDQLEHRMKKKVKSVTRIMRITPSICRILLNHYKWDKKKLLEKYCNCSSLSTVNRFFLDAKLCPPSASKAGTAGDRGNKTAICQICFEETRLYFVKCGHGFCQTCWQGYLFNKISEKQWAMVCPEIKCGIFIDDEVVIELLSDENGDGDQKQLFHQLKINSFVDTHRWLRWCPTPNCGCALKLRPDRKDFSEVVCGCGNSWCAACGDAWHEPIDCRRLKLWIEKTLVDECETMKWLKERTKDCPNCKKAIEKDGGCNHMTCTRCRHQFCWLCRRPWNDHQACNALSGGGDAVAQTDSRQTMERYLHYSSRFVAHRESRKMEERLVAKVESRMANVQQLMVCSWPEVKFLREGVDALNACRQTLMYSYAFAYYLKPCNQAYIFEDNQNDLEQATEQLSFWLESDAMDREEFSTFRPKVCDKTTYVKQRQAALVKHCVDEADNWDFTV